MTNPRTASTAVLLTLICPLGLLGANPAAAQAPTGPTTPPPPMPAPTTPTTRQVDIKATIQIKPQGSVFLGRGKFTGKPFTAGRFETRARVVSRSPLRVSTQITLTMPRGRVILNAALAAPFVRGRARVLRGTGAYKGIKGSNLTVSFTSGSSSKVRLKGVVRFIDRS